jgi:hypothetical protein
MTRRARIFVGSMAMIAFVSVYALLAMSLTQSRPLHEAPETIRVLVFAFAGLLWILPLMPLIRWMERRD